ncbi:PrgI family protein [Intestinimonas butyriciproducens]|uniref:PrgI family protein n=1 Tax=Intestinimonas butyriciproducens TaxID=1297617 RepID=UPI003AF09402
MPYVNVPNDLSKIKTKLAFNLTKRQLICFGGGAAIGIPAYLLTRSAMGNTGAMFLMIALMLPAFFMAMYERDGLPFKKVVRNVLRAKFLRPGVRPYQTQNIYAPFAGKEEPVKLVTEILGGPQAETVKEETHIEQKAQDGEKPDPRR